LTLPIHGGYAKEFLAGWGTMDFNGHMANTAYLDGANGEAPEFTNRAHSGRSLCP
jgi:hypothetical protein